MRGRREKINSESEVPTVYPVETNSREEKPQLVLESDDCRARFFSNIS